MSSRVQTEPSNARRAAAVLFGLSLALGGCAHLSSLSPELEDIGPEAPPGARAHRDALKLLAAFVQHTDSKAANQRLLCPEGREVGRTGCRRPVLMVNDLGLTFSHAGLMNRNVDSASLATWAEVPVWRDREQCVAELKGSFTGSLGTRRSARRAGRSWPACSPS